MLTTRARNMEIETALRRFSSDGFARLGVVATADALHQLRSVCVSLMQGTLSYPGLFFQHDSPSGRYADLTYRKGWIGPSLAYRKMEGLERDPSILDWIKNPLFERLARARIGPSVSLYRAVLWNKAAGGGTELPWHQDDGQFWGIDHAPSLQIWTALDDAPADSGCVEVIPGSHLRGLASPQGGTVLPKDLTTARAEQRAIALSAKAGEAILLHNHVWHRSGTNTTAAPRRALSISYLHGATRCTRKRRAPRTFLSLFERL